MGFVIIGLLTIAIFSHVNAQKKEQNLIDYLEAYSDKNGQDSRGLRSLVFNIYVRGQLLAKGGIGLVRGDLYVDLSAKTNRLILPGGSEWLGRDINSTEVIYVIASKNEFKVSSIIGEKGLYGSIMIVFEKDRVCILDFEEGTGGFYTRRKKT